MDYLEKKQYCNQTGLPCVCYVKGHEDTVCIMSSFEAPGGSQYDRKKEDNEGECCRSAAENHPRKIAFLIIISIILLLTVFSPPIIELMTKTKKKN